MEKVIVVSNSKSPVLVKNTMMNFRREWPRRGARVQIDREQFEELCNVCPGFVYMLKNNLLYTDNLNLSAWLEKIQKIEENEVG